MNYEQKYKEALERAKDNYNAANSADINVDSFKNTLIHIFPELKESEDEKIRKRIIQSLHGDVLDMEETNKAIAWLEKKSEKKSVENNSKWSISDFRTWQYIVSDILTKKDGIGQYLDNGECRKIAKYMQEEWGGKLSSEKKSVDKVEPKFKVGDWIIDKQGLVHQIENVVENVTNHTFGYDIVGGGYFNDNSDVRLWSIEDAKDGDVLCTYECDEPKIVFVLKGTPKKHCALRYYCYYNIMYPYFESDSETGCLAPNEEDVKPATEEQCDILFQKMKEAGYKWNVNKKELIKL